MTVPTTAQLRIMRRSLLWRLHFWAALIASPFALLACATGLLYAFTPQIEGALYRSLDVVQPAARRLPLDDAVAAAQRSVPEGIVLQSVIPALQAHDSVRVAFVPPAPGAANRSPAAAPAGSDSHANHAGHVMKPEASAANAATAKPSQFLRPNFGIPERAAVVYVDPYTATVLGTLPEGQRFSTWARKLHSSLLQGENWRWMIELAASWLMVMLVTGVVLWWPQQGQSGLPARGLRGRLAWKQWHAFLGAALSVVSLVMLTTGLTWSRNAGSQVRWARDIAGQAPPRIPGHFKSMLPENGRLLGWEQAYQAIRREAPDVAMQIMPPVGREGFWRANSLEKKSPPAERFDLLVDAYSGNRLYFSGWSDQTAFGKATAIGIPFHRGEFGWWNQAILVLFGSGILFSLVSGWTMFIKRLRAGGAFLPPLVEGAWRHTSPWAWLVGGVMLIAMPLLTASAMLVAVGEAALAWQRRRTSTRPLPQG